MFNKKRLENGNSFFETGDYSIEPLPDWKTMSEIEYYENGKIKRIVFRDLDTIQKMSKQTGKGSELP